MTKVLLTLLPIMSIAFSACSDRGEQQEAASSNAYTSAPAAGVCSVRRPKGDLKDVSSDELVKLNEYYLACVDDQNAAESGRLAALGELYRRGDGRAAADIASIYKYRPAPDRKLSIYYANEAVRLGERRGRTVLDEWARSRRSE